NFHQEFLLPKSYNNGRGTRKVPRAVTATRGLVSLSDLAFFLGGLGQVATKGIQSETVSTKLISRWEQVGQKLAALAEEIPESKFDYKVVDGVRTFADVLRHVAFWNHYVADSARGKKGDDSANELPKSEFSTKALIVDALKRSALDASIALKEHKSGL